MILRLNGEEADLLENNEVSSQINSPLTDFKLVGDKSYAYNIPATEKNRKAIKHNSHPQAENVDLKIQTVLSDAGIVVIEGEAEIKRITDDAITLNCSVPPANIPALFWNKKLRTLDFGSQKLTAQKIATGITVLNKKDKFYKVSNAAFEKTLEELLFIEGSVFRVLNGKSIFFKHTFGSNGSTKEDYLINAKAEFEYIVRQYNTNRSLISVEMFYISGIFSVVSTDTGFPTIINFEIYFPAKHPIYPGETFRFLNPVEVKYEDIGFDLKLAKLEDKPFFFPTIDAPYFYGEKNGDYIGYINYKEDGELKLNGYVSRTSYPLVPCFRFRFVFEKLIEMMGYSMYANFWEKWENLSFCSMRDFAKQHPDTSLPFNVYNTEIKFSDYMPDWTVLEFFNEFGYLVGAGFDFYQTDKEVKIVQYDEFIASSPVVFTSKLKRSEISFDDEKKYQLSYTGLIETEMSTDDLKSYFADFPISKDELTKIPFKFLPFPPILRRVTTPTARDTVKVFCHSIAESTLFDFSEERPSTRIFFYNEVTRTAETENTSKSLSRVSPKSITSHWKDILSLRKGKKVNFNAQISTLEFSKIKVMRKLQIDNINYIIKQVLIKVKKSRVLHEVALLLEQIS